ncbi:MAG: hypothetical protein ABIS50_17480 [Luteolibacter sp.]|uniref:hypothetical protein n=1 Tax=Luteolibacter sp. TaxID=1962973 RepID=UPI0032661C5B
MSLHLSRAVLIFLTVPTLHAVAAANTPSRPAAMAVADRQQQLSVAELQRIAAPALAKMMSSSDTRGFVQDLLASKQRMADLMLSGPLHDPAKSLRILAAIWKADSQGVADRHEQTTAAAVALMFAQDKWPEDKALDRYKFYRDSRLAGQLHPQFDTLETWEKCFVVSGGQNGGWSEIGGAWGDDSLVWLRDNVKLPVKDYLGACWQAPYKLNNLFGDSIHGANYYAPFNNEIHAERVREVGGVCGSLSHYGATAARANGLPAITMGEPGHCSYAVRVARGDWEPAYSLSWERGLHTSLWGKTWTQLILQEKVLGDRAAYTECMVNVWQARAAKDKNPDQAEEAYAAALEAQPLNYAVWTESVDFLKNSRNPSAESWEIVGKSICTSLGGYPEAAWDVLSRIAAPALKDLPADQREAFFLIYHDRISKQEGQGMWDYEKSLDEQLASLNESPAQGLAYFEKVLAVQSSSKMWFAPTIAWGRKRFGEGDAAAGFFAALGRVFSSVSPGENTDGVKAALGPAILAAENAGNLDAFQSLGKAGASFHKKTSVKAEPFPGTLLSSGGLLQTSSTCHYDSPVDHWGVLEEDGGSFHTDKQVRPNAVVRLGKLGDVSGVVIVGTDYGQNGGRQMPLKVSISEDGLNWNEVFRTTTQQGPWRIPLTGKAGRVLYVKAERDDDRDEYFHLAGIRVYGRKLQ